MKTGFIFKIFNSRFFHEMPALFAICICLFQIFFSFYNLFIHFIMFCALNTCRVVLECWPMLTIFAYFISHGHLPFSPALETQIIWRDTELPKIALIYLQALTDSMKAHHILMNVLVSSLMESGYSESSLLPWPIWLKTSSYPYH